MYKVMYNDVIIDVLKEVRYGKYLTPIKRTIVADSTNANCIMASNNKDRYHVNGMPYPEGLNLKTVSLIKISEEEYNNIVNTSSSSNDYATFGVLNLKRAKIEAMREKCTEEILDGASVLLSDNEIHHFAMTLEDQLNLLEIRYLMDKGQDTFIYHETNGISKEYHSGDMSLIIDALFNNKQKHLLYFNKLKHYINSLTNIDDISRVTYGMKLDG